VAAGLHRQCRSTWPPFLLGQAKAWVWDPLASLPSPIHEGQARWNPSPLSRSMQCWCFGHGFLVLDVVWCVWSKFGWLDRIDFEF
jgi:hypothetical protein